MTDIEIIRQRVNHHGLHRPGIKLVEQLVRERPGVVIDIGANIGGFIPTWLGMGATAVHAFEPVPWVFDEMERIYGNDPRCHLRQIAISDITARIENVQICGAHTLARPQEAKMDLALEDRGPFTMHTETLDSYVRLHALTPLSLIKLDVDGYEFHALRGMSYVAATTRVPIMIELSFLPRALGQSCESMVQWIYSAGYKLCTMDGEVCEDPLLVMEAYPWRTSFDMVAVPPERIGADWPRVR